MRNFITDGYDPTLRVTNYIDNDTDFNWTDYHVKITMGIPFSVTGVSVANVGWTTVPIVPPSFNATEVSTGTYFATLRNRGFLCPAFHGDDDTAVVQAMGAKYIGR
jgi:hypothetical protein